jgi:hypothetical protein
MMIIFTTKNIIKGGEIIDIEENIPDDYWRLYFEYLKIVNRRIE